MINYTRNLKINQVIIFQNFNHRKEFERCSRSSNEKPTIGKTEKINIMIHTVGGKNDDIDPWKLNKST